MIWQEGGEGRNDDFHKWENLPYRREIFFMLLDKLFPNSLKGQCHKKRLRF